MEGFSAVLQAVDRMPISVGEWLNKPERNQPLLLQPGFLHSQDKAGNQFSYPLSNHL